MVRENAGTCQNRVTLKNVKLCNSVPRSLGKETLAEPEKNTFAVAQVAFGAQVDKMGRSELVNSLFTMLDEHRQPQLFRASVFAFSFRRFPTNGQPRRRLFISILGPWSQLGNELPKDTASFAQAWSQSITLECENLVFVFLTSPESFKVQTGGYTRWWSLVDIQFKNHFFWNGMLHSPLTGDPFTVTNLTAQVSGLLIA